MAQQIVRVGNFGLVKVWIDDDFGVSNVKAGEKCSSQRVRGMISDKENTKIIIEYGLNGNVSSYGLLGIEYLSAINNDILDVNVFYQSQNEDKTVFKESLSMDKANAGLLEEYLEFVLEESLEIIQTNKSIPAGQINFLYAANSPVYSSGNVYKKIVRILLEILCLNKKHIDEIAIIDIVKRNI